MPKRPTGKPRRSPPPLRGRSAAGGRREGGKPRTLTPPLTSFPTLPDKEGAEAPGEPGAPQLNSPTQRELVLLGEIVAAQGLKGEVRLRSYTAEPAAIAEYGPLQDEHGRLIEIESVRAAPKALVARIKGVTGRDAAEALIHTKLYVPRERLPAEEEDEWYYTDLIGLRAFDTAGVEIGIVVAIQNYGAGDLIEIKPLGGGATVLVPFTRAIVPEVDVKAGSLTLDPPEGLFE